MNKRVNTPTLGLPLEPLYSGELAIHGWDIEGVGRLISAAHDLNNKVIAPTKPPAFFDPIYQHQRSRSHIRFDGGERPIPVTGIAELSDVLHAQFRNASAQIGNLLDLDPTREDTYPPEVIQAIGDLETTLHEFRKAAKSYKAPKELGGKPVLPEGFHAAPLGSINSHPYSDRIAATLQIIKTGIKSSKTTPLKINGERVSMPNDGKYNGLHLLAFKLISEGAVDGTRVPPELDEFLRRHVSNAATLLERLCDAERTIRRIEKEDTQHPSLFNIDRNKIEGAINKNTNYVIGTHRLIERTEASTRAILLHAAEDILFSVGKRIHHIQPTDDLREAAFLVYCSTYSKKTKPELDAFVNAAQKAFENPGKATASAAIEKLETLRTSTQSPADTFDFAYKECERQLGELAKGGPKRGHTEISPADTSFSQRPGAIATPVVPASERPQCPYARRQQ